MIKLIAFAIVFFTAGAYATDIELTWTKPELREDGSQIQAIDKYNLYHHIDNVSQSIIEVDSNDTSHTVSEATSGVHSFQISTVEAGLEGEKSDSIYVNVEQLVIPEPSPPAKMQIEVTVKVIR